MPLMGARDSEPEDWCRSFEGWIEEQMSLPPTHARDKALSRWNTLAPDAAIAHPRSQAWPAERGLLTPFSSPGEHLMPWFFAYGVHRETIGRCVHKEYLGSLPMAAYEFSASSNASDTKTLTSLL